MPLLLLSAAPTAALHELAVPHQDMAVVVMPGPIARVYLGSEAYVAKVQDNFLLLRASQPSAAPTSLLVLYQGRYFHAQLKVSEYVPAPYDLSEIEPTGPDPAMAAGIALLEDLPQGCYDVGKQHKQLLVALYAILQDKDHTYLKVFLSNSSSVDFHIATARFAYQGREQAPLSPLLSPSERCIPAHRAKMMVYVLPRYGTQKGLKIVWEEDKGERKLTLQVPAKILLNAPYAEP